jgi:hypothetical protein
MALGSSLNFDFIQNVVSHDRRLDRLPSLFFTYFFYKVFPPIAAHYLLYFFSCYAITFLAYFFTRKLLSRESGVIAAMLFGTSFWIFPSFGNIWINRQMFIFLFLALLFIAYDICEEESSSRFVILSGFFTGCAFFSHFAVLPFLYPIPLLALTFRLLNQKLTFRWFITFSKQFLIGGFGCLVLFGLNNWLFFKGPLNFFANQLSMSQTDYTAYLRGFEVVFGTASNSVIIFALMASVMLLIRNRFQDKIKSTFAVWFIMTFLLYALFYYVGTFFPKSPIFSMVLWFWYYCRWLMPICAATLFVVLLPREIRLPWWKTLLIYSLVILSISSWGIRFMHQ